jgi:hypothetical protein
MRIKSKKGSEKKKKEGNEEEGCDVLIKVNLNEVSKINLSIPRISLSTL